VRDGSGYCEAHQADRKINKFADDRRGSRHERGYGTEWDKLRNAILRRDKGLCQVCLAAGKYRPAKQVDHIRQKSQGGTDAEDNLQSICVECHQAKTASEAAAGRGG
jgi:5-methylcytosine-specific restriction protein A